MNPRAAWESGPAVLGLRAVKGVASGSGACLPPKRWTEWKLSKRLKLFIIKMAEIAGGNQ